MNKMNNIEPEYRPGKDCPPQPDRAVTVRAGRESEMSAQDFRLMRDAFGMSAQDFADYFGVRMRTVQRMSARGAGNLDVFREELMLQLDLETREWHRLLVENGDTLRQPVKVHAGGGWRKLITNKRWVPESWWAMIVGRALLENPGINWEYVYD